MRLTKEDRAWLRRTLAESRKATVQDVRRVLDEVLLEEARAIMLDVASRVQRPA